MMKLLELRTRLKMFYQRFQLFIDPSAKFLLALITFLTLNKSIGYDERFAKFGISLMLSLLCAFTPSSVLVLLSLVLAVLHVYSVSPILSILILIMFVILYCFLFRYAPSYGYAAVIIPVLYLMKVPFIIPILFGLIATPVAALPAACGVIIHYILIIIKEEALIAKAGNITLEDAQLEFMRAVDKIISNKQMFLAVIIFSLIIIVVYVVRSLKIDYSFELSIAAGVVTGILGFLIGYLKIGVSGEIVSMILGTIASGAFVLLILFTKRILDYTAVESVQFEDDDYYYYVKAIPKIEVSAPDMKVKRINRQSEQYGQEDEDFDEEV